MGGGGEFGAVGQRAGGAEEMDGLGTEGSEVGREYQSGAL